VPGSAAVSWPMTRQWQKYLRRTNFLKGDAAVRADCD
jgi:hypothetical protein